MSQKQEIDAAVQSFHSELSEWCEARGLAVTTVSARALSDSRGIGRMLRRVEKTGQQMQRVRDFMDEHDRKRTNSAAKP